MSGNLDSAAVPAVDEWQRFPPRRMLHADSFQACCPATKLLFRWPCNVNQNSTPLNWRWLVETCMTVIAVGELAQHLARIVAALSIVHQMRVIPTLAAMPATDCLLIKS